LTAPAAFGILACVPIPNAEILRWLRLLGCVPALFAAGGQAFAAGDVTDSFLVHRETPHASTVERFACQHSGEAERDLTCSVSLLAVSYYDWTSPPKGREAKRCHVTSSKYEGLRFAAAGAGRWTQQVTGLCRNLMETAIVVRDGQVTVTETTLQNPDFATSAVCKSHGLAGTVVTFEPARFEAKSKRACSSLAIDPY
jgi:hypothetical protein